MISYKKINKLLGIRGKIILLLVLLTMGSLLTLSYIAGFQFRNILLKSTLVVCRNLSYDLSDVAREELLINSIYVNTKQVIDSFQKREVNGLENAYVVYKNGIIVAHTNPERTGKKISKSLKSKYSKFKKIRKIDNKDSLTFVDPILIHYEGQDYFLGYSVFEFNRKKIFGPIDDFLAQFWTIAILFFIAGLVIAIIFASRLSRPIEELAKVAELVGQGQLGLQVNIQKSDEIGKLADAFNQMSIQLDESQKLKIEEATMHKEMEIAKDIQMSMLPMNDTMGPYECRGFMETADDVGGDYYDCIEVQTTKEKNWWFVIGDVSGHGLSAGLTMLMAQTAVHTALTIKPSLGSKEFFTLINSVLYKNIKKLHQQRYMTATFLRADSKGNIQYSGLHLDLLVYKRNKKEVEVHPTDGLWLGIEPDIKSITTTQKLKLSKGDVLFLFTDGMVEAMNDKNIMFSQETLARIIKKHAHGSLQKVEEEIIKSLDSFCKTESYEDDITFLMIRKL